MQEWKRFDVGSSMKVVEHVNSPAMFFSSFYVRCRSLQPGGHLFYVRWGGDWALATQLTMPWSTQTNYLFWVRRPKDNQWGSFQNLLCHTSVRAENAECRGLPLTEDYSYGTRVMIQST